MRITKARIRALRKKYGPLSVAMCRRIIENRERISARKRLRN